MILGIDEAGRGPWAGPLVVGAVVLGGAIIEGLTDSKKLSKKKREMLYDQIVDHAAAYASGWVSARELDEIGMSAALKVATKRAVEQIMVSYSEIIIDGTVNFLADTTKGKYVKTMPKADLLIPSVSAASIIAKVERDRYMATLDTQYEGYGFKKHAGYGVLQHRLAIEQRGVTLEHRLSFAPLAHYRTDRWQEPKETAPNVQFDAPMVGQTTRSIGDSAEELVTLRLQNDGHSIIERNWRTKFCEIDIISQKDNTVYFTEVKYRKNDTSGDGLSMITAKKQQQMQFAAAMYAHARRITKRDLRLMAVAVTGQPPEITDVVYVDS